MNHPAEFAPLMEGGGECLEKSAYIGHCGLEVSEINLPLFIDETRSRE